MNKSLNLIDLRFGNLTVVSGAPKKYGKVSWICLCDCGGEKITTTHLLRSGQTKSCGCLHAKSTKETNSTHGKSATRVYRIWQNIKKRCRNPKDPSYPRYGGKGIDVSDRWFFSFANFLSDMGEPPENLTLDRRDGSKGYFAENCRWATPKEQSENSSRPSLITFDGKTLNQSEWARKIGISQSSLNERLEKWPLAEALSRSKSRRSKHRKPTQV